MYKAPEKCNTGILIYNTNPQVSCKKELSALCTQNESKKGGGQEGGTEASLCSQDTFMLPDMLAWDI